MTITGTATAAEIFTENIEESALNWITSLCDHPAMAGVPMSDERPMLRKGAIFGVDKTNG